MALNVLSRCRSPTLNAVDTSVEERSARYSCRRRCTRFKRSAPLRSITPSQRNHVKVTREFSRSCGCTAPGRAYTSALAACRERATVSGAALQELLIRFTCTVKVHCIRVITLFWHTYFPDLMCMATSDALYK